MIERVVGNVCCALALLSVWSCSTVQIQDGSPARSVVLTCVQQSPERLTRLWQIHTPDPGYLDILTHPCSGAIYIADPNAAERGMSVLWQGWWLQGMYPPVWNGRDALQLRAKFITGVGPTGAQPFVASISARRTAVGWMVDEPVTDEAPLAGAWCVRVRKPYALRSGLCGSLASLEPARGAMGSGFRRCKVGVLQRRYCGGQ